MPGQT